MNRTIWIMEGARPPKGATEMANIMQRQGFEVRPIPWSRHPDEPPGDIRAIVYLADEHGEIPPFADLFRKEALARLSDSGMDAPLRFLVGPSTIDSRYPGELDAELIRVRDNDFHLAAFEIIAKIGSAPLPDRPDELLERNRSTLLRRLSIVAVLAVTSLLVVALPPVRERFNIGSRTIADVALLILIGLGSVLILYRYLGGNLSLAPKSPSWDDQLFSKARLRALVRKEIRTYSEIELSNWLSANRDRVRISEEDRDIIAQSLEARMKAPIIRAAMAGDLATISAQLAALERRLSDATTVLTDEQRKSLVSQLSLSLESTAARDVVEKYGTMVAAESARRSSEGKAAELIGGAERRLVNEIATLSRRANLNLAFGSITAIVGVILLAWLVLRAIPPTGDLSSKISYYTGRYGLVLFVEVFAYFFLRLYKSGLGEIKFFQNELTSVQLRGVGLHLAMGGGCESALNASIELMMKSERNRILDKGQTTADLEEKRIDEKLEMKLLTLLAGQHRGVKAK